MTHDILQTDIELAKELLGNNRPAEEVAIALTRRGIDLAAATQLVDDLRNGRPVQPQMPAQEWVLGRRSSRRRRSPVAAKQEAPTPTSQPEVTRRPSERRPHRSDSLRTKAGARVWLAAVILTGLVATGAVLGFKHWQRTRNGQNTALVENRPAEDIRARVPPQTSPSDVELEIRTNGLHLGGVILTPKEAWRTVTKFLGTPTQTNRFHGDKLIYAFANHGVLLYSEPNAETDSVVVDFEGVGGINGTASPFRGKLSVEDQVINSDTAPRALLAMKQLGFKEPESPEEGFFAGQYHDLELVFAYQLKNPKKLSQLEISLK